MRLFIHFLPLLQHSPVVTFSICHSFGRLEDLTAISGSKALAPLNTKLKTQRRSDKRKAFLFFITRIAVVSESFKMQHRLYALFAAGAAVAIPVAQEKRQTTSSANWSAVWAAEQTSMVSVLDAMAAKSGSQAPYKFPAHTTAPNPYGATSTSAVTSNAATSTSTSAVVVTTPPFPSGPSAFPFQTTTSPPSQDSPSSSLSPTPSSSSSSSGSSPPSDSGSGIKVTNPTAFRNGAACAAGNTSSAGVPAVDTYKCHGNTAQDFPASPQWATWDSMWAGLSKLIPQSCSNLGDGAPVTPDQVQMVHDGIQAVAGESLVDARVILAVMMQESKGCVNVGTTNNGVSNPGLMQSHAGVSFVGGAAGKDQQQQSITQMIRDGVVGTASGLGLVQGINQFGNVWEAARNYNSGCVNTANLNDGIASTAGYVNGIAN